MKNKHSREHRTPSSRGSSSYAKRSIPHVESRSGRYKQTYEEPVQSHTNKSSAITTTHSQATEKSRQNPVHLPKSPLRYLHYPRTTSTKIPLPKKDHIEPLPLVPTLPNPTKNIFKRLHNSFKHSSRITKLILLLIVAFFIIACITVVSFYAVKLYKNTIGKTDSANQNSGNGPTIKELSSYTVANEMPKYVKISSIGVWSRIISVDSGIDTPLNLPTNAYDTAWYEKSAKPGQPGVAFLASHITNQPNGGTYAGITNIKAGSLIEITMGDDTKYQYTVEASEPLNADRINPEQVLRQYDKTKQGLNIMVVADNATSPNVSEQKTSIMVYAVRLN